MSSGGRKYTNYYQQGTGTNEDEEVYKYYTSSTNVNTSALNMQNKYELDRAQRQMGHYFDASKPPQTMPPITVPPTKAQLQYWKQRKEEKKKKKNAWLYE